MSNRKRKTEKLVRTKKTQINYHQNFDNLTSSINKIQSEIIDLETKITILKHSLKGNLFFKTRSSFEQVIDPEFLLKLYKKNVSHFDSLMKQVQRPLTIPTQVFIEDSIESIAKLAIFITKKFNLH